MFRKTRPLCLTFILPIKQDDSYFYITKFIIMSIIKPSCKYSVGNVLS